MKAKITVLSIEQKQYPARDGKEGKKYQVLQCVAQEEGEADPLVGVLKVYNEMQEMQKGDYIADFGLAVSWDRKEIGGGLKSLHRVTPSAKPSASSSASA